MACDYDLNMDSNSREEFAMRKLQRSTIHSSRDDLNMFNVRISFAHFRNSIEWQWFTVAESDMAIWQFISIGFHKFLSHLRIDILVV